MLINLRRWTVVLCFSTTLFLNVSCAAAEPGETHVARWMHDKKAALLLMFDDSMPSHVKNVVPELKKRGLVGTFYVNPGKGEWGTFKNAWEKEIPAAGMEYGNHTHTHQGILSMDGGEQEIGKCNEAIQKVFPERKSPRLISFGVPGVKKGAWLITKEQLKELLDKYHLVERPHVGDRFALINLKTSAEMLKVVDKAIEDGSMDSVAFHGVGGEWLSVPLTTFIELLDGLETRREKLWITDHISAYKYETERASAEVKVLDAGAKQIRLSLTCKADAQLFDQPLTLITQVPARWQKVQVVQGAVKTAAAANGGTLQFEALPSTEPIVIQPAAN